MISAPRAKASPLVVLSTAPTRAVAVERDLPEGLDPGLATPPTLEVDSSLEAATARRIRQHLGPQAMRHDRDVVTVDADGTCTVVSDAPGLEAGGSAPVAHALSASGRWRRDR